MHFPKRAKASAAILLLVVFLDTTPGCAQGALKTIIIPQGGKIVYGQVEGQTTEAGAMGALLRALHTQYGNRPQVGKLFEVKGTQSVAAFFSVKKTSGQMNGFIIAAKVTTEHVEAAVITDDVSRFASSFHSMMKTLFGAWHPFDGAQGSGPSGSPPAALHKFVLPDNSASAELPDGWKVLPSSGGGTILAEGPNGESAYLGLSILASDTNNASVRRTQQILARGGLRNTAYANAIYYPYGGDLSRTFVDLIQMQRKRNGAPPGTIQVTSSTRMPVPQPYSCTHLGGQMDRNDGKGSMEMNTIFCTTPPAPAGSYLSFMQHTLVPQALAAKERSTIGAILASFSVNQAVVRQEAHAIAAPVIEQIHAIGRAAAAQADAAHRNAEIHNSSVYQRWDTNDRRGQEFSNYLLGYSVVQDNYEHTHGTLWNADADELVRRDPERFEYVTAPNFWKYVDY